MLNEYIPFFEKTTETKSLKDYSDVTLVLVLSSPHAITGLQADFDNQVEYIKSIISRNKFKAK